MCHQRGGGGGGCNNGMPHNMLCTAKVRQRACATHTSSVMVRHSPEPAGRQRLGVMLLRVWD